MHIVQCEQIDHATDEELARSAAIIAHAAATAAAQTRRPSLYLIWADENVHKLQANRETQAKLSNVFGKRFLRYETADEVEESIQEKNKKDSIILVISGRMGRDVVPKIHDLEPVKSIMVYCMDAESNKKWSKDYTKV